MDDREKLVELLRKSPHLDIVKGYKGNDCTFEQGSDWLITHGVTVQECKLGDKKTNADRIKAMSDEELAEFLTHINPTNCKDCAFSHGWRCQPDRDDYSDFEKCKEGRRRWLQQPAEESDND